MNQMAEDVLRTGDDVIQWWINNISIQLVDEVEDTRINFRRFGLSSMRKIECVDRCAEAKNENDQQ